MFFIFMNYGVTRKQRHVCDSRTQGFFLDTLSHVVSADGHVKLKSHKKRL